MSTFQKYNLVLFIVLAVLLLSSPLISFISFNSVDAQRQGKPPGSGGGTGGGPPPGSGGGPPPQPPATLIVFKQVINDNGGTAQASDFTFSVIFRSCDGSTSGTGQLQASSQGVTIQMNAQDTCGYQVFELVPETYTLTAMSGECQRSAITPGATYRCTIVN
ncbi:MAG: hypothetical protein QOK90_07345, partial [Nitrososphaeraceae archaeon]|nr:hypothetical protein [Nitrososphaeraceae archaeon]